MEGIRDGRGRIIRQRSYRMVYAYLLNRRKLDETTRIAFARKSSKTRDFRCRTLQIARLSKGKRGCNDYRSKDARSIENLVCFLPRTQTTSSYPGTDENTPSHAPPCTLNRENQSLPSFDSLAFSDGSDRPLSRSLALCKKQLRVLK